MPCLDIRMQVLPCRSGKASIALGSDVRGFHARQWEVQSNIAGPPTNLPVLQAFTAW